MVQGSERKARVGVDHTFVWTAPVPGVTSATLTITHPTLGALTPAMTQVAAALTVTAIGTDRRTLTVSALAFDGIAGNWGRSFLVVPNDGTFPVDILRWDGTTGILAAPLPRDISLSEAGSLVWAHFYATLPAANATSAVARSMLWQVTYTGQHGGSLPTEIGQDSGLLHVVRHPFDTGLTHHKMVATYPESAPMLARANSSWDAKIEDAKDELILRIRGDLAGTGRSEDGVLGSALYRAHQELTASLVFGEKAANVGASVRGTRKHYERFEHLYDLAMRSSPWVDEDGDGVVDSGETGVALKGPRAIDHRGNAKRSTGTNSVTTPRFSVGDYR